MKRISGNNVFSGLRAVALAMAGAMTAGCASVATRPITSAAVASALADPSADVVRASAAELRHPTLAPIAIDLARGLSPDEAAVVAVIVNPDLRAARDARSLAAAQLLQAGLLPNPQLAAGFDVPYRAGAGDRFTAFSGGLNFDWSALIARDAKRRAAASASTAVVLDVAWKEWQVAEAAKLAAFDAIALRAAVDASAEVERGFAQNAGAIRRAVDRRDKTIADLASADASTRDATANTLAQRRELRRQLLQFNRALGVAPDAAIALRDVPLPSRLAPPAYASIVATLDERRLDLIALRRGYDSQEATLRAAVLGQFPRVNVGLNTGRDTSDIRTFGLGVSIDLPIFDRNQGVIAAERATRDRLFDEYVSRVQTARHDVAAALGEIASINEQIANLDASLPSLERLVELNETALREGNADVLGLYAARGAVAQKRIDAVKMRQQLVETWIALELASGRVLPMDSSVDATTQAATTSRPILQESGE